MAVFQENKENSHLLRVLNLVRKRPGMFLLPTTLDSLRNFLSGYSAFNLYKDKEIDWLENTLPDFYEWIGKKEHTRYSPSMGWVEILNSNGEIDEEVAFNKFFVYLDEYIEELEKITN